VTASISSSPTKASTSGIDLFIYPRNISASAQIIGHFLGGI
jgi:hypothetical protein